MIYLIWCGMCGIIIHNAIVQLFFKLRVDHLCHVVKNLVDLFVHFRTDFMIPDSIMWSEIPSLSFRNNSEVLCTTNSRGILFNWLRFYYFFVLFGSAIVIMIQNLLIFLQLFYFTVIVFIGIFVRKVNFIGNEYNLGALSCFLWYLFHPLFYNNKDEY